MRKPLFLSIVTGLAWSSVGHAQNYTHYIDVTTSSDLPGMAQQCTLREAFDNVNAGGKVGNNGCGAAAKTSTNETTYIRMNNRHVVLGKPIFHTDNHATIANGIVDSLDKTPLFDLEGKNTKLYVQLMILQDGEGRDRINGVCDCGGAVTARNGASLDVLRAAFVSNAADGGGAIAMESSAGPLKMRHAAVVDNHADDYGGGIYAQVADIANTRFSRNTADIGSGAAFIYQATIRDSRFEDNEAGRCGGMEAGFGDGGFADLFRVYFARNKAAGFYGGALCTFTSATIADSRFEANGVGAGGISSEGGALDSNGSLILERTSFDGNSAAQHGAAVHLQFDPDDVVTIKNNTFYGNTAPKGGALSFYPYKGNVTPGAGPLGSEFALEVLNNSFLGNGTTSQIELETGGANPPKSDILMVNNLIDGEGIAACSGNVARVVGKRPNDLSPTPFNLSSTDPCGGSFGVMGATLGAPMQGWFYDQFYMPPTSPWQGDKTVCTYIGDTDQFDQVRATCVMGAIESTPPKVYGPFVPWG